METGSADDLRGRIEAYLDAHVALSLATQGSDGPWAASLYYARDGDRLIFVSDPQTRHGRNIEREPRVAATVHDEERDWRRIRGLQLAGLARRLASDEETAAARAVYLAKFPFARILSDEIGERDARKVEAVCWYELRLLRARLIDNTRGFGFKEELEY